jgi:hypothetical protein
VTTSKAENEFAADLVINDPSAGTPNDTVPIQPYSMPGMPPQPVTSGTLCVCDGTLADQGSGRYFYGVYLVCKPGHNATFTDQDWQNSTCFVSVSQTFNGAAIPWGPSTSLICSLNDTNITNNSILAHAMVYDPVRFNFVPNLNAQKNFQAKSVRSCTRISTASTTTTMAITPFGSLNDVSPIGRKGDWYNYRGLSASVLGYGSRLMLNGAPLNAGCIEVAADKVLWQRGITQTRTITRAVGELLVAPPTDATRNFYWVPGAPQSSLIVSQPSGLRSVLMSESRSCPDVIVLDRNSDVHVGVNFNWLEGISRNGTFDLWVKIVD